jgi:hypothetical protein
LPYGRIEVDRRVGPENRLTITYRTALNWGSHVIRAEPGILWRAARYVDRSLAKLADLPVAPTKLELVINPNRQRLVTIPPSLLGRADEVIQ